MRRRATPHLPCLLTLLAACAAPPTTDPSVGTAEPPPVFSEQVDHPPESSAAAPVPGKIHKGECPAVVANYPAPYFDDRVLIRLPMGVTEDNLVEMQPGFARIVSPVESANCRPGMPGAMIDFMALTAFAEDPDKPLDVVRDELLEVLGYPRGTALVEQSVEASHGMWVYEVPASDAKPPAKMLLALAVHDGLVVAAVYEVHPNAWTVIVDTLVASASRISIVPA